MTTIYMAAPQWKATSGLPTMSKVVTSQCFSLAKLPELAAKAVGNNSAILQVDLERVGAYYRNEKVQRWLEENEEVEVPDDVHMAMASIVASILRKAEPGLLVGIWMETKYTPGYHTDNLVGLDSPLGAPKDGLEMSCDRLHFPLFWSGYRSLDRFMETKVNRVHKKYRVSISEELIAHIMVTRKFPLARRGELHTYDDLMRIMEKVEPDINEFCFTDFTNNLTPYGDTPLPRIVKAWA